ncbi:rhomboid family intramembrane serine protease [Caldalkalibacillus mannanilyticus]|uniref:rhomboid family intramembrane serine protease n=1 Tax=Caldalkalibacillus mannanilyticus TaxID=1418 RepID=UPI0004698B17|nr:rhomboid family intramembrane serine protease [Caldalkalibacillus mannanilyticus]
MFIRYERFDQFIRLYPIVTGLLAINLGLFLLSIFIPSYYTYIHYWGVGINIFVAAGEYWRLITPVFLHAGLGHVLFNSFSLLIFGPALERILGGFRFTILYLFAGFIGNVGTFLFEAGDYMHLGASGAIYGLLGLYFYMRFFRQDLIDPGSAQIVTTVLIIGAIYTAVMPGINILGHLFGFVGGTLLGPVIFPKQKGY